jgi:hypothetical protein
MIPVCALHSALHGVLNPTKAGRKLRLEIRSSTGCSWCGNTSWTASGWPSLNMPSGWRGNAFRDRDAGVYMSTKPRVVAILPVFGWDLLGARRFR